MGSGGHNKKKLEHADMEPHYSSMNSKPLLALGRDSEEKVFWEAVPCYCILYKSMHAVSNYYRRKKNLGCFACPWHDNPDLPWYEQYGYATISKFLDQRGYDVVLQACVVPGCRGAFDMWVPSLRLLIEIDGEGHTNFKGLPMYGTSIKKQQELDIAKSMAAVAAKFSVVRLHWWNENGWVAAVQHVVQAIIGGAPAQAWATLQYQQEGLTLYRVAGV
jgi:hypothetical protein